MKITREQSKYPYYGKAEHGNVVYFTGSKEGVLVAKGGHCSDVGYKSENWVEENFTPIPNPFEEKKFEPITITLETEEEAKEMYEAMNSQMSYEHGEAYTKVFDPRK
tara:strand:+ start:4004 stop:4324 length:321 start_codon:yes stop_codon:yes gene_type:complete